jgi:hypothetical protein
MTAWDPNVPAVVHVEWPRAHGRDALRWAFLLCALMTGWAGGDTLQVMTYDYWSGR